VLTPSGLSVSGNENTGMKNRITSNAENAIMKITVYQNDLLLFDKPILMNLQVL